MQANSKTIIVGCGAVITNLYFPVLKKLRNEIKVVCVVDPSENRRLAVANELDCVHHKCIEDVGIDFENAIIASPAHAHAPIGVKLLAANKNVLIEKPMASSTEDCNALLAASRKAPHKLSIGHLRRFSPAIIQTRRLLDQSSLGRVEQFTIKDAAKFNWPVTTDHPFRRNAAGGGVLMDTGSHVLDTAIWLFGRLTILTYEDDSETGVEADCVLKVLAENDVRGEIILSRIRDLPTTLDVKCERGDISTNWISSAISRKEHGHPETRWTALPPIEEDISSDIWSQMLYSQLLEWSSGFDGKPTNVATGGDGAETILSIHQAYAAKTPLHHL